MIDPRVLVIGLDGATFDLIEAWREQLPTLNSLLENGVSGELRSTVMPLSPAAWTSFATGKNPGKHGIFDFSHPDKNHDPTPNSSRDRKCEAIWNILSRHGKKVCVINVPGTYPPEHVNGFMVSGFPTPEEKGDFTHPSSLLKDLRSEIKRFRLQLTVPCATGNEHAYFEEQMILTNNVTEATLYLMNKLDWDLLITVYKSTDDVSHLFWRYMDKEHPFYDAAQARRFGDRIFRIYKEVDKSIGMLLEEIDDNTVVILMSDHGFGPVYYGVCINNWLLDQEMLKLKTNAWTRIKFWMFKHGIHLGRAYGLAKAMRLTGFAFKRAYKRDSMIFKILGNLFLSQSDVDWSRTRAYSIGNIGQIYVNLQERGSEGTVTRKEYDELVRCIIEGLREVKDPKTEKVIFDRVFTRNEIFYGPFINEAPDIVFFDSEMKYLCTRFFEFGENKLIADHPVYSGYHKQKGIFVATGNGIKREARIPDARIIDLAPTIMHIFGLPIPRDMDGRVLRKIFEEDSEFANSRIKHEEIDERLRIMSRILSLKASGKI